MNCYNPQPSIFSPNLNSESGNSSPPAPADRAMKPERWQQIKGLYESALRCDEGKRASFLDQACAGDPALRREVESLLAYENRGDGVGDGFIETPALEVAARALTEEKAESLVGRQLGSYKILSFIGAGGMGEVYQARDTKLGREVALKVLPEVFARDAERLGRFRREALLLASLNHPNIAAIYGLEESEGVCYLVLELVPGKTLAERVDAGPLDVREALRICGQIAEGLEAAHDRGIVHRDLKPANIKVTAEGKVKVLDFGLAKTVAGDGPRSFAFPHGDRRRNRERRDSRDGRLHEPGAGAGPAAEQADRHLVVRLRAVRIADRTKDVCGGHGVRHRRPDPGPGTGLEDAARNDSGKHPPAVASMSGKGFAAPSS